MTNQILLIFSSIFIYEFIRFIKFTVIINSNFKIYKKIIKLYKYKKGSDFRKEKLIFIYSKKLFMISIKIFSIILGILIFMIILNLLSNSFINSVISIFGIIKISLVLLIYHQLKKKINAKL